MAKNKGRNALKTIAWFLVVVILLAVIGGAVWLGIETKGFKDWSSFKGDDKATEEPAEVPDGDVTDGEGNALTSGTTYALPMAMVYAATTEESETASEGITVQATVLPVTAIDKNVTWSVSFANAESEWATGKTAEDYLTVTRSEEDSRTVTLVCNEAFGEQILLTATSVSDPTKSATCTVDFAQQIESVTVRIGNVETVLGGDTNVTIDIGHNDIVRGGVISIEYTLSTVYTLAEEIGDLNVYFSGANKGENYFRGSKTVGIYTHAKTIDDVGESDVSNPMAAPNAIGLAIYFDQRLFGDYNVTETESRESTLVNTYDYSTLTVSELYERFNDTNFGSQDLILWTMTGTVTGKYHTVKVTSNIVWHDIDGWAEVEEVQVDPSEVVVA